MRARWSRRPPISNSSARRSIATVLRRSRPCRRSKASIRARWKRRMFSRSTRRAATRAWRCSSSAPGRTGAIAPISRAPIAASRRPKCSARSWRSSTRTSRRRGWCCCRTRSRSVSLLAEALTAKAGVKIEVSIPQRGEKRDLVNHALANAREALGRKLADSSSQMRLLAGARDDARLAARAEADRGLRQQPHPGHQRGRRHDRRRHRRVHQEPVPQVQYPLRGADAGRRLRDDARGAGAALQAAAQRGAARASRTRRQRRRAVRRARRRRRMRRNGRIWW